ncbi:MAG: tRNA pseudouridine(55) synthase TruB [Christensenellales bacterium]
MIGVLVVDKPRGISSSDVVVKVKKLLNEKKVGHMGTLDPLAEGVLPLGIGKATKLFDLYLKKRKEYIATFAFGKQTDTLDLEGEIVETSENIPTREQLEKAIKQNFLGKIKQLPPKFSSKKIAGKRACDIVRGGGEVSLLPCEVEIYNFEVLDEVERGVFRFRILCSAGTYIRSLARDIASAVNSVATMTKLVRTKSGPFLLENAVKFDKLTYSEAYTHIIPLEKVLEDLQRVDVSEKELTKLRNGIKYAKFIGKTSQKEDICVWMDNKVVGLGEVRDDGWLKIKTYF